MEFFYCDLGSQVNVSPKVDFIEDNQSEHVPPKVQGIRVIVDAGKMNGSWIKNAKIYAHFFF